MRRTLSILLLLCMLLLAGCETQPSGPPGGITPGGNEGKPLPTLTTVVFSIGKADAILLYNRDHAILIDAGEVEDGAEVLQYLQRNNIGKLDALILTHYDKDHVGGAADVLNGIVVDRVYGTYPSKRSAEYDQYVDALADQGLTPTIVESTTALSFGDIRMTVYPPEQDEYNTKESNNSSLIIHMTYGKTSYLFGGDAQEARVAELIQLGTVLDCDFMKVPYHGNAIENFSALLEITTPAYAVITCSDKNPEDYEKTLALRDIGARVFLTRAGNVYARSDGITLSVSHQ